MPRTKPPPPRRRRRPPLTMSRVRELERRGYRVTEWINEGGRARVSLITPAGELRTREVVAGPHSYPVCPECGDRHDRARVDCETMARIRAAERESWDATP